jgi:hypothetical protein
MEISVSPRVMHDPQWRRGTLLGVIVLVASGAVSVFANRYATAMMGGPVADLLLDHMPLLDVTAIHIYAATLFWVGALVFCCMHPSYLPFTLKTMAAFVLLRSGFVTLTHLGPPANLLQVPDGVTGLYIFQGDLFFSGHAGSPFLLALILRRHRWIFWVCLLSSIGFAATVLLGRLHYSIDVFAAYFIAHSVYTLMWKYCSDRRFIEP